MSKLRSQFKKENQQSKNYVDRSKFKCYNCGMADHFFSKCRSQELRIRESLRLLTIKRNYFKLLRQKKKTFIIDDKDWATNGNDFEKVELI